MTRPAPAAIIRRPDLPGTPPPRSGKPEPSRSGAVPADVRRLAPSTCRLRGHALRRFADWLAANPQPSVSAATDAYAEARFELGASVATVAVDLGAVRWWAAAAGIEGAASLGRDVLADTIRIRAAACKLDASGHSLRVGSAVSMASRGASLVAMQQAGGWSAPDMPAHYERQASVRRGAVATLRPEDKRA